MISKAVLEGAQTKHEMSLSLYDLQSEFEDLSLEQTDEQDRPLPNNIMLKIKIETSWDTSQDLEDEELEVDYEDEEDGNDSSGQNQSSH